MVVVVYCSLVHHVPIVLDLGWAFWKQLIVRFYVPVSLVHEHRGEVEASSLSTTHQLVNVLTARRKKEKRTLEVIRSFRGKEHAFSIIFCFLFCSESLSPKHKTGIVKNYNGYKRKQLILPIIQCERFFRDKVSGAEESGQRISFKSEPLFAIDRDSVTFLAKLRLPVGTLKGVHSCSDSEEAKQF
ncbi:hypothetical protein TNIN_436961 [Trichonephila inaurata madagascariensis]|uniref:Uncharacterized protein n=1 Tax=Trichonephila inaurata madagascariensis TaxID=2747483 RepID=A0A8X6J2X2_9ARAC|nr:hypothetical protein TNIN_436961 [Trichonephila inaurata madagascariensis]